MAAWMRTRCSGAWPRRSAAGTRTTLAGSERSGSIRALQRDLSPAAQRELRKLRAAAAARLRVPILSLAFDPRPPGSQHVAGSRFLRIREVDLRVVYVVRDDERVVIIVRVARRSESTYRRLPP